MTITKPVTVMSGHALVVSEGGELVIEQNAAVNVYGRLTNSGSITGSVTVPAGGVLLLKERAFDGETQMHNSYVVSADKTLKLCAPGSDSTSGGTLICRDGVSVNVKSGAEITANGYMQFDTLTVNGTVYTEEGGVDVTGALTVSEGGVLEVGSAAASAPRQMRTDISR